MNRSAPRERRSFFRCAAILTVLWTACEAGESGETTPEQRGSVVWPPVQEAVEGHWRLAAGENLTVFAYAPAEGRIWIWNQTLDCTVVVTLVGPEGQRLESRSVSAEAGPVSLSIPAGADVALEGDCAASGQWAYAPGRS